MGLGDATKGQNSINSIKSPKKIEFFSDKNIEVKQVSCSKGLKHCHTGCVSVDGRLFMWGDPYKGQLGHYTKDEEWTHKE